MKILWFIVVLAIMNSAVAEEYGYVGEIDLDNDGIKDKIQSGPMSMFGNGGGPMVVTLSANKDSQEKKYLIGSNTKFAVEFIGPDRPVRLWSYWHLSSSEGVLTSFMFTNNEMTQQHLKIFAGQAGSVVSSSIIAAIFKDENMFNLKRVNPYTPPPHPTENQWGK